MTPLTWVLQHSGGLECIFIYAGQNYESSHTGLRRETGLGVSGMFIREGSYTRMSKRKAMVGYSTSNTPCMAGRGRLIRLICITILYHNLLLFMDIFHIRMQYLHYFILFCMFDDRW